MRLFCRQNHKVSEDNIVLNAKNGQIRALQKVIDDQTATITGMSEVAAEGRKGAMEDRLLDIAENMFLSKPKTPNPQTPLLESGVQFTEVEIRENLSKVPTSILKRLRKDENKFKSAVRGQIPTISEESLDKAFKIAQEI